jgi:hypothetical protein
MRKTPRCFQGILAAILLSLLIPIPLVTAQGSAGQIEGVVRDEQGGVLPGVTLTVPITIRGESPVVDTTQAEVAGVVTRQQIETLPLNSRNYLSLALLVPGTTVDAS